jgi:hypothetical protein
LYSKQSEPPIAVGNDPEESLGIGLAHGPGDGFAALVQTEFFAELIGLLVKPAEMTQRPGVHCSGMFQPSFSLVPVLGSVG